MMYPLVHLVKRSTARLRLAQMNNSPRANVFPAGQVNFEQAVYRSLERSPQDTRDGFDL